MSSGSRRFAPKPECCACGIKVYSRTSEDWYLMDVTIMRGYMIPITYPYRKGVVCGTCKRRSVLLGTT